MWNNRIQNLDQHITKMTVTSRISSAYKMPKESFYFCNRIKISIHPLKEKITGTVITLLSVNIPLRRIISSSKNSSASRIRSEMQKKICLWAILLTFQISKPVFSLNHCQSSTCSSLHAPSLVLTGFACKICWLSEPHFLLSVSNVLTMGENCNSEETVLRMIKDKVPISSKK